MRRTQREIEALADMFLGGPSPPEPIAQDRITLLVEGHLPVRGTLWRTPAAELIAQSAPGMLLEVDDRELHARRLSGDRSPITGPDLEHLVQAPDAGHLWVVAGGTVATAQADTLDVDDIVLLTGIDQMAVVGAYQLIKQLASARAQTLSLIIAGAAETQAHETWQRLADTAREHLNREITLRGTLERMDALPPAAGCTVAMPSEGVGVLIEAMRARTSAAAPARQTTPQPTPTVVIPGHETTSTPPPPPESPRQQIPEPAARTEPPPGPDTPRPSEPVQPTHTRPDAPLPTNLTPMNLPVDLPDGVTVALDETGGVHLVAPATHCGELERARQWAGAHLALIAAARSDVRLDRGVACDVVVDDVHQASDLADGPWQIHLRVEDRFLRVDPRS